MRGDEMLLRYGILHTRKRNLTTDRAELFLQTLADEEKANVRELNLSDNQLNLIPESVKLLTNMAHLNLSYNNICEIPEWIGNMKNLTCIYLHANQLSSLPVCLLKLKNMRHIYLEGNDRLLRNYSMETLAYKTNNAQRVFCEIVLVERKKRARLATVTWLLVGKRLRLHKDMSILIGKLIYDSRREDEWDY